jgi:hypothetical protein
MKGPGPQMLTATSVRNILESESDRRAGCAKLADTVHQMLGLVTVDDKAPRRHFRPDRKTVLNGHVLESSQATARPEDFSITSLAIGIFGGTSGSEAYENMLDQTAGYAGGRFRMHRAHKANAADVLESGQNLSRSDVLEAGGTELAPSAFANVSAFNATTAGLFEAKLLDMWQRPEFMADQYAEVVPSVRRAEKVVGISIPGDSSDERKPGNAHPRATLSERYVTGPNTINKANAIDVTREAIMFDYTKQLLTAAEKVVETLALRREYLTIQKMLGVVNDYTYDGTTYNTYLQTSDSGNWVNKLAANNLIDWTNVNSVNKLLTQMTDQETGQPINVSARQIIVMPAREVTALHVLRQSQVERASSGTGAGGLNASLAERSFGPAFYNGRYELLTPSIYTRRILTNATTDPVAKGLGITDTNADQYWLMGDFKKGLKYAQQLPLTTIRVDASNYQMADNGLVFSIFFDEMGVPFWQEPRCVVLSTN